MVRPGPASSAEECSLCNKASSCQTVIQILPYTKSFSCATYFANAWPRGFETCRKEISQHPNHNQKRSLLLLNTQPLTRKGNIAWLNWLHDVCIWRWMPMLIYSNTQFYNQFCNLQETVPTYKLNQRQSINVDCKIGQDDGTLTE